MRLGHKQQTAGLCDKYSSICANLTGPEFVDQDYKVADKLRSKSVLFIVTPAGR